MMTNKQRLHYQIISLKQDMNYSHPSNEHQRVGIEWNCKTRSSRKVL